MSQNNRLIAKNIFDLERTEGGDSSIMDLWESGPCNRFSLQSVYTVTAVPEAAAILVANIKLSSDPTHPSEFFKSSHGMVTGMIVQATTAGTLAVPLVVSTNYYVIRIDADYFALATTYALAEAGTKIVITNVGVTSTTLTPGALASSLTFKRSNDRTNWTDIQAATTITATGSLYLDQTNVAYRYLKANKTLTGGDVALTAFLIVIGDAV